MITWIGILCLFAIALPTLTFLVRSFVKQEVRELKSKSIKNIEKRIERITEDTERGDLEATEKLLDIVKRVNDSADYPLRSSSTVFNGFYSVIMGGITLVSPILPIIESNILKP
jgi:hypothetical protein